MSLQGVMTRLVFGLPTGVVRMLAGPPVVVDGKTLDPRIALMAKQAAKAPPMSAVTPDQARAGMQAGFALIDGKRRARVAVKDMSVPGGGGTPLPARLYTPPGATGREPLIVYLHQGGCVLGGLWTCDTWCSILAEDAGVVVLNVDYRHAPEHKFPTAVDDAIAAFEWARENAAALGADPARVGVGGDSAGGYLSAVICHAMKRAGKAQPALQLLIYPAVDWAAEGGSMATMAQAYPLNRAMMDWFSALYLNDDGEKNDWRVSPGREDCADLAPAFIYTAGFDPLTSQGADYSVKLKNAGTPAVYRTFPTLSHSFTAMSGAVPAARAALAEITTDVKRHFG